MPRPKNEIEVQGTDLVAPIESVETEESLDKCWNCAKGLQDGVCAACGFDKNKLYNLNLEADKAAARQKLQQVQSK